ncbi:MAG TPA: lycopene cyclase family protein, partial [Propionibacteriaceae bacterium]|nr:lycopene cyclase family protein [Propionibacteriaceae bacterium]
MTRPDVAVVGLGPAGRALAHRLLARGARVLAVDPHPERPWLPTYGGWAHQLPDWLPERVVGSRSARTVLVA